MPHPDDQTAGAPPFPMTRILVPVDMRHTGTSRKAIATAVHFARPSGAKVFILTVVNPFGTHMTDMPEAHEPDFKAFVALQSEQLDYPIEAVFRSHESVNDIIQQTVKQHGIDFVVMASHHPRLTDHLFGSHASQTALHANCSVLVVRD